MSAEGRKSRRVLIVGATGRLGAAIAEALANRGDELVLTARDPKKLEHLSVMLDRGRGPAKVVCADLTHREAVRQIVEKLRASVPTTDSRGSIDDIVLACGPFPRTPFEDLRREDLERTLTVHAIAPLLLVHALAGDLAKAKGAIVELGDAGTTRPFEHYVAYLTAKGAMRTGLRALAVELAPAVRVNIVELGIVAEPDPEADTDPLRKHRLATRSQLGRFGAPEEVAHVVLALLDATWATGEIWGVGR
ncbi:MAG: SDR family oxidoreductase [Polyangiaceae bacterium]|nr:SDR family oxidoreductase [Polyangiaceae bacterium]